MLLAILIVIIYMEFSVYFNPYGMYELTTI